MGKLDKIITTLGGAAPEPKYIRAYHGSPQSARPADDALELWPPTDEQLMRLSEDMYARRPKNTMDRMAGVFEERGLEPAGTLKDVEASLIGRPSQELGPGGISTQDWIRAVSGFPNAPNSTPVYVVDPIRAVASQYPAALRDEAIDIAKRFQIPVVPTKTQSGLLGGSLRFQMALGDADPRAIVFAYPGRQNVARGASGLAHAGVAGRRPGLVEVAAGRRNSPEFFDRVLLHELRHTLEGGGLGAPYDLGGYAAWRPPRSLVTAGEKRYLSRTGEEVARFGDARARYAQHSGRLIADAEEAEHAASMILANQHGLGAGFYAPERAFYQAAREADPNIRAHQNRLLQGLLSVPAAITAGAMQDQQ